MTIDEILARVGHIDNRITAIQTALVDDYTNGLTLRTSDGQQWRITLHAGNDGVDDTYHATSLSDRGEFRNSEHAYTILDAYVAALRDILT